MQPHDTTQDIPYGYCHCGCGEKTNPIKRTNHKKGHIKGKPCRFVDGHQSRKRLNFDDPNPSGLCLCGCGETTPLAPYSSTEKGWIRGKPVRFVVGHYARTQPEKPQRELADRFWEKVNKDGPVHPKLQTPCWLWTANLGVHGYGKLMLGEKSIGAHRISWVLAHGQIPDDLHVLHHCDVRNCVNPEHLYLGDNSDNHRDMILRNRVVGRKLNVSDIPTIRQLHIEGKTNREIGELYDVSATTISLVVRRKTYIEVE